MLLRTTSMRRVDIDPATGTARAEAGAVWQDVIIPAAEHGLAGLAGNSPGVGVAGHTLGGGLGFLARRYGLAANSVTAAELVTLGGDLVRADAGHEPKIRSNDAPAGYRPDRRHPREHARGTSVHRHGLTVRRRAGHACPVAATRRHHAAITDKRPSRR
jgi:hypothetical protein